MARVTLMATSEALRIVKGMVDEHDKILVRGNGDPSLQEDVRTIKRFMASLQFWMTAIGIAFVSQTAAAIWYFTTHIYPILEQHPGIAR